VKKYLKTNKQIQTMVYGPHPVHKVISYSLQKHFINNESLKIKKFVDLVECYMSQNSSIT